ncbi:BrxA/BrxB family bacilliredoxin [Melioribacteraceae bacterium 4301-Me]|uniref:BrxA/BrxB family bacilliredoxin n=1 Tax=Pyranulibacter aquaticus TaxID=3163344 RepID=UPI003596970A
MFNINLKPPIYDPEAVQPMRDELIYVGFEELLTPQRVEDVLSLKDDKTTLVMINSVCGCAAGSARPGVTLSLQHNVIPDRLVTVFAGQDRDAVDYLREKYLSAYPPSSPSLALIKNCEVIFMMPRYKFEGRYPEEISEDLRKIYDQHCGRKGPSISEEKYAKLVHAKACGSKIPLA